jgi:tRNA (adenine37-N6)-methyltransferase
MCIRNYEAGLISIERLFHLILLYIFHQVLDSKELLVRPFLDDQKHGVFATHFYRRSNQIGPSVVRLI